MKRNVMILMAMLFVTATAFAEADAAGGVGKSLTVRTFQFKHKQADKAAAVIKPLMSAEGSMSIQPAANSLVVTELPENLKKIAAALAQFDAPAQALNLSIRLVSAGRGRAEQAHVDPALRDVESKLALLRYNVLESIGAATASGSEGEPGLVELNGYRADFKFGEYDPASDSVKLTEFRLSRLDGDQLSPMLKTTLNLKLGQTVIIGATKQASSNRALMIVVTAQR
ncbi:MAG TPA: secretin N-terminal domain-containing protein [Thermoanaerobaculia bacterium]|nr:secretin N-terminal domain-containing protein [Thermoanaerobaculia bacterium]